MPRDLHQRRVNCSALSIYPGPDTLGGCSDHMVLVPISGIHRGVIYALEYAKSIAPGHVKAVYVNLNEDATQQLKEKWLTWGEGAELVVLQSPLQIVDKTTAKVH